METLNNITRTKFNEYSPIHISSNNVPQSLCHPSTSEYYMSSKRCVFERLVNGDPAHCPNTENLQFCESHECPDSYKCPRSYCIALHMVCDEVNDCPESEDELFCSEIITAGLLYCRLDNIYIHPRHICDGIVHCIESYDDESLCEMSCPRSFCFCKGYTMMCVGSDATVINTPSSLKALFIKFTMHNILRDDANYTNLQILDLADTKIFKYGMPKFFFRNMTELLILNLHNTSIARLANNSFQNLTKLEKFTISKNTITTIHTGSFIGLSKVLTLDLSYLSIRQLEPDAFVGLSALYLLNISNNLISILRAQTFSGLNKLAVLDTRFNRISNIQYSALNISRVVAANIIEVLLFRIRSEGSTVIRMQMLVDSAAVCCFAPSNVMCRHPQSHVKHVNCAMLISKKGYVALYWLCSFVLSIYGGFVLFVQIRQDTYNGQLPLMLYVAAKDVLTSLMAMPVLIIHFVYLQNYPMQRSTISRQFLCKLHGFLTIYTELIAKEIAIVMVILHYRIIVNAMTKRPYTIRRITKCISAMSCFDFILSFLWTYFSDTESSFLCSPYSLHTKVYSQTINIIIISLFLFYNFCLLSLTAFGYFYTFYRAKRNQSRLGSMNTTNKRQKTTDVLVKRFSLTMVIHSLHFFTQIIKFVIPLVVADFNDELSVVLFYSFAVANATAYLYLYNRVHLQDFVNSLYNINGYEQLHNKLLHFSSIQKTKK